MAPDLSEGDRSLTAAAVAGTGLGVFSMVADGVIPLRALTILGNLISPWAIAAFAVGRFSSSWKRGGLAGTLALLIGVAVYYVGHGVRLAITTGDAEADPTFSAVPLVWLVAAVSIGPLLGMAGAASKRHEPVPVTAIALPCVVLLAEAGFLVIDRRPWLWNLAREPHRLNDLVIWIVMIALAVVITVRGVPDRGRRTVVYIVSLMAAAAGSAALIGLYRLLVHLA